MNANNNWKPSQDSVSRRDFLKTSAVSAASAAMLASGNYAFAAGSDIIKVGLIGCGGRGSGAAQNACEAASGIELVALADLFPDHLEGKKKAFGQALGDKFKVKDDHCFTGFDAYNKLLATDCNYVILATPPGYRPIHLRAAVDAGKNVFFEKPVAVDGQGCRTVIEAGELAKQKGLSVVTGTQRRHQPPYLETIKRIHDGAIGDIVGGQVYWNGTPLWMFPREASWSDSEWQHRNWYYFTWLCGDHIVEQHVHNIDVMNWVMNGPPVKAIGMGGRQVRTAPAYGHIYDHFACEFEFANGARFQSMCRHHDNTATSVSERMVGTKGRSFTEDGNRYTITPYSGEAWSYKGPKPNPYVVEHTDNIAAIRAGKPLNEAKRIAESTCTAILGREACYTGQALTFDQVLNSKTVLMPPNVAFGGSLQVPPVAMPGKTTLERAWNE
jgi:predicted dehydrogenase